MTNDRVNRCPYNADSRICVEASTPVPGFTSMTGYLYDAEGNRVAKGTITSLSCNPATNGLTAAGNETDYILGPSGEQVTEMAEDANGSMNWQRTYVYAAGALIATYDPSPDTGQPAVSFRLTDWLGTMRVTTDASGVAQSECTDLPFGDQMACQGNVPDAHYFTGKERDAESGNDYFGARYYSSAMGRFLSPDPSQLFYADRANPQSLNLYSYVRNNPLVFTDPSGEYCAWEDGTSDDDPKDGGATKKQCKQQGGHWTDASNPCHGMDNCVATFDWNNPHRDKTPTFDPSLDPFLVGVAGATPLPVMVTNVVDPDKQRIQLLAVDITKDANCATHGLVKNAGTTALDAVGIVPFGGDAEIVAPVAVGAVGSVTSAVQGDTTGSALSTVDMVQGAVVKGVTSPVIGINAPKAIPLAGQAYSAFLVARDIWNASGEYANCF